MVVFVVTAITRSAIKIAHQLQRHQHGRDTVYISQQRVGSALCLPTPKTLKPPSTPRKLQRGIPYTTASIPLVLASGFFIIVYDCPYELQYFTVRSGKLSFKPYSIVRGASKTWVVFAAPWCALLCNPNNNHQLSTRVANL